MKKILAITTIALTAIGVAVRAKVKSKERSLNIISSIPYVHFQWTQ